MALHNDIDPLPKERVEKIKNLTNFFSKIKIIESGLISKLANAIFLLKRYFGKVRNSAENNYHSNKMIVASILKYLKPYLPHLSIAAVTIVVILSNLIVKYAKADYTISVPDPANEIGLASTVDPYTRLIKNDGISAETAYQNSGGAFVALNASIDTNITQREEPVPDNSGSTITYDVKDGDTLSMIGLKFGVKLASILYVNNLDNADLVKPGQQLKIPPRGYEASASQLAKQKEKLASAKRTTTVRSSSSSRLTGKAVVLNHPAGNSNNGYPYGYCTYYVATRRYVPSNWGNAKSWLSSAQRAGYSTGSAPVPGAIGVTPESWWGHVVYVESVNGDRVTVSEMNAVGWGKVDTRTMSVSSFRGFIY